MRFSELYSDTRPTPPAVMEWDLTIAQPGGHPLSGKFRTKGISSKSNLLNRLMFQGTGQNLEILPEEIRASEAIVDAVKLFSVILSQYQGPEKEVFHRQFVDGIHLCQSNLGSLRFFHTLNQRHRQEQASTDPLMTSPEKLYQLSQWKISFDAPWKARQYPAASRKIIERLLDAWQDVLALTKDYPDQHNYDDFFRGIMLCESILARLQAASLKSTQ